MDLAGKEDRSKTSLAHPDQCSKVLNTNLGFLVVREQMGVVRGMDL